MRILRSIVAPSAALMAFCDSEMTGCGGIRSQLICDELVWLKAKAVCPISVKYISLDFFGLVRTQIGLNSSPGRAEARTLAGGRRQRVQEVAGLADAGRAPTCRIRELWAKGAYRMQAPFELTEGLARLRPVIKSLE